MKFGKRLLALAAAGTAAALFLSGAANLGHVAPVSANGPGIGAIGCVNSTDATKIQFQALVSGLGPPAYVIASGNQLPSFSPTNLLPITPAQLSVLAPVPSSIGGLGSYTAVTCGAVFQDTLPNNPNPNLIDGGTITFSLIANNNYQGLYSNPLAYGGPEGGIAQILESNGSVYSISCGSAPAVSAIAQAQTCQGGVTVAGTTDNPASPAGCTLTPPVPPATTPVTCTSAIEEPTLSNTVHVGLKPNISFSLVGGNSPVITLSARYDRFSSYPVTGLGTDAGATTLSTQGYTIGIVAPSYAMTLTPTPSTIPSAVGTGTGSTITAALSRITLAACTALQLGTGFVTCPVIGGVQLAAQSTNFPTGGVGILQGAGQAAFITTPGAESGVVTFNTTSGIFGNPAIVGNSAQQVVSVHCGQSPATVPTFLTPQIGQPYLFSFQSCTSVTTVLYGGGQAGTAVITASYVGDITGGTATAATTVALSAAALSTSLSRGCNEVITPLSLAANASATQVLALVNPSSQVVSIWQFNNSLHAFQALYFSATGNPPVDITSVGPNQSIFICVSGTATFQVQ